MDFPRSVWTGLCLGTVPAAWAHEDIDAISAHSQRAAGAYTDAAKQALREARRRAEPADLD